MRRRTRMSPRRCACDASGYPMHVHRPRTGHASRARALACFTRLTSPRRVHCTVCRLSVSEALRHEFIVKHTTKQELPADPAPRAYPTRKRVLARAHTLGGGAAALSSARTCSTASGGAASRHEHVKHQQRRAFSVSSRTGGAQPWKPLFAGDGQQPQAEESGARRRQLKRAGTESEVCIAVGTVRRPLVSHPPLPLPRRPFGWP